MEAILGSIIGALAAGAIAKASEVGGKALADAYDGFRALLVRKLGKGGAVASVEDEPRSEAAQATLVEALTKADLAADPELAEQAKTLQMVVSTAVKESGADIKVGDITAKANVMVRNLVAAGRIDLGNIRAETGDATLANLRAGVLDPKKP